MITNSGSGTKNAPAQDLKSIAPPAVAAPSAPNEPRSQRKQRRISTRMLVIAAIVVAVIAAAVLSRTHAVSTAPVQASGTIEGVQVDVGYKQPGRLASLLVKDGQLVRKGQTLASLDGIDQRLGLQQAEANYEAAVAKVSQARSAYALERDQYPAAVAQAQANAAAAAAHVPQATETVSLQSSTVAAQLAQAQAAAQGAQAALAAARAAQTSAAANLAAASAN